MFYIYELLTTFLGAVAAPLVISDSDFGPEQIVPAAPVPALHPCITYAFVHAKHLKSITRVQIASRFLHWNTRDIARSRFAAKRQREVSCHVYSNRKSETGFEREWCCVSTFFRWRMVAWFNLVSMVHLSIGSMVQRYKSDPEKRPGRSGRSLGRSWIVLVGWVAQVAKNYHIRQELFRPPTSLEC